MDRREFIKNTMMAAGAAGIGCVLPSEVMAQEQKCGANGSKPLITSAPMLQNYAETSIGVAFSVSDLANGFVIVGEKPDLSDGKMVKCGGYRTTGMSDKVCQVRITGLKPSTKYYYRIGADRIAYKGCYNMSVSETYTDTDTYSFETAGQDKTASFCVINDTHADMESFSACQQVIEKLSPSCVIWNGDIFNFSETIDDQINTIIKPSIGRSTYASFTPYLFCPGNHDYRGLANRHLENVWMYRQSEERISRDWDLGRNFAVRLGEVAMIGLDTGEDKLDTNPHFAGLFNNGPYRKAQTLWLEEVLSRDGIRNAPFIVVFCHIPLYDSRPNANPGDVYPADEAPEYSTDYALWQRTCFNEWGPLLDKSGCQLVVTAHQHCWRVDDPDEMHSWTQIVGGGHHLSGEKSEYGYPTVVSGKVDGGVLVIKAFNVATSEIVFERAFPGR